MAGKGTSRPCGGGTRRCREHLLNGVGLQARGRIAGTPADAGDAVKIAGNSRQPRGFTTLLARMWNAPGGIFSAGAIIDAEILIKEHAEYPEIPIYIHPCAAVVSYKDIIAERDPDSTVFAVAGTRSGTGAVLARKIKRDRSAIYYNQSHRMFRIW